MTLRESELDMVNRHVLSGNICVLRQRRLLQRIGNDHPQSAEAKQLLDLLEYTQRQHLLHRHRIRQAATPGH